jgi:hypothetical protein
VGGSPIGSDGGRGEVPADSGVPVSPFAPDFVPSSRPGDLGQMVEVPIAGTQDEVVL